MYETFQPIELLEFLRGQWRVIVIAAGTAIVIALAVSLLLTKRYTSTASIVIEPPGANDVRTATAVSPVYLESLKTYERFASSDSLFARAASQFHLGGASIEALKRSVLKVSKLRDTKILEISATLPDPKLAQRFVEYLANETVNLSRQEGLASDTESIAETEKQLAEAQARLEQVKTKWAEASTREPAQALQAEADSSLEVLTKVRQELVEAEADAAESESRELSRQLSANRARVMVLRTRAGELEKSIAAKSSEAALRAAKLEGLQMTLKTAQTGYDALAAHLRELRGTAGTRGERLRVIDPGIVPERPSSPNIVLNLFAATFVALVASVVYLSVVFAYRRASPRAYARM